MGKENKKNSNKPIARRNEGVKPIVEISGRVTAEIGENGAWRESNDIIILRASIAARKVCSEKQGTSCIFPAEEINARRCQNIVSCHLKWRVMNFRDSIVWHRQGRNANANAEVNNFYGVFHPIRARNLRRASA